MQTRECICCGKPISGRVWACESCAQQHGLDVPSPDWPRWAKEVRRLEEIDRSLSGRTVQVIPISELSASERHEAECRLYGEYNSDL